MKELGQGGDSHRLREHHQGKRRCTNGAAATCSAKLCVEGRDREAHLRSANAQIVSPDPLTPSIAFATRLIALPNSVLDVKRRNSLVAARGTVASPVLLTGRNAATISAGYLEGNSPRRTERRAGRARRARPDERRTLLPAFELPRPKTLPSRTYAKPLRDATCINSPAPKPSSRR